MRATKSIIVIMAFCFFILFNATGQDKSQKADSVEIIKDFKNLFRYQNFFIGGQPTLEELKWIESQGVKKIINLRSEKENTDFSQSVYDEKSNALKLGFEYYSIPIESPEAYNPVTLNAFLSHININEKIFIHCQTGGRATTFMMAYLIKNKDYTINEAVEIGKELKFSFPLEMLLNAKVSMEIIE